MSSNTGRSVTVLSTGDTLTLGDLRELVRIADERVELPGGATYPALEDDVIITTFQVGARQGILAAEGLG